MDYAELSDMVQTHEDTIIILSDNQDSLSENFDQYTNDTQPIIDDLQQNEGQLMFPLSQDTIDLIKEQIPEQTQTTYGGQINADGTAALLPLGWTSSADANPYYTIVHNLNTTSYAVVAMSENNNVVHCYTLTKNANNFVIEFLSGGSDQPTNFDFTLTLIT